MSERYSRLFALSENLYATGAPVVIAAGALLKDNQTGKVIAQLKLRNISGKAIKAVTVSIAPRNTAGNPLGEEVSYQYLDLNVCRDMEFGQKAPIALPDASTRAFDAKVVEVVFSDSTLWSAAEGSWEPLSTPSPIGRAHGAEFEKQFRLKYGSNSKNLPLMEKDLWFCACGALNRQEERYCFSCKKALADMTAYNETQLLEDMKQRLAAEKAKAEQEAEAARLKAEQEAEAARLKAEETRRKAKELAKKSKKPAIIAAVVIAAVLLTVNVIIPAAKYAQADKLVKTGQYEQAIEAYSAMEASEKRDERIAAAHYAYAEDLIARKEFDEAVTQFKKAGDYEDAEQRINATYYAYAEDLLAQKEFEKAVKQFKKAGNYSDAKERISGTYYAYAEDLLDQKEFEKAVKQFKNAGSYSDAKERIKETTYAYGEYLVTKDHFDKAIKQFESLGNYKDAAEKIKETKYANAEHQVSAHQRYDAYLKFKALGSYSDAKERAAQLKAELEQELSIELVYFNTTKEDSSNTLTSIPHDTNYLHYGFKVNGLHPGEKIELVQVYQWPGEQKKIANWTWEDIKAGKMVENTWKNGYEPDGSGSFQIEIHIYDSQKSVSDAAKPIGKFSINIQAPIRSSNSESFGIGGSSTIVSSAYGNNRSIW